MGFIGSTCTALRREPNTHDSHSLGAKLCPRRVMVAPPPSGPSRAPSTDTNSAGSHGASLWTHAAPVVNGSPSPPMSVASEATATA